MSKKEKLKNKVKERLEVPLKAIEGDENKEIERDLGFFLVEKGYIQDVEEKDDDWSFVYYSVTRKIAVSQKEMPHGKWEQCIFKMGVNRETGENLFPSPGEETEKYRFLHEANHAYQEYLCAFESPEDPKAWHEKVIEEKIESYYGDLFYFCFQKRAEEEESTKETFKKGLSVWGNAPNYNHEDDENIPNKASEIAVRAQEDANELATMFLWHPEYFNCYLDYLSLNHENSEVREKEITKEDLIKNGLVQISKEEADYLRKIVSLYVEEMKSNINC